MKNLYVDESEQTEGPVVGVGDATAVGDAVVGGVVGEAVGGSVAFGEGAGEGACVGQLLQDSRHSSLTKTPSYSILQCLLVRNDA